MDRQIYNYKYLTNEDQKFIDGMQSAGDDIVSVSNDLLSHKDKTMLSNVEEYISDEFESESEDDSTNIDHLSDRERKILELGLEFVTNVLQAHISTTLLALIDKYDEKEFKSRKQKQDEVYQSLQLVPDMTLVDEEGYDVGTIKSVDDKANTVAIVISGEETAETWTFDKVKQYTIFEPIPLSITYTKDKIVEHYRFGGDKEVVL